MKKINGACTSARYVLAAGGLPVCQTSTCANSSAAPDVRAGSSETPKACAHWRWSYVRPNTAVSV